jgi:hypothetical protein
MKTKYLLTTILGFGLVTSAVFSQERNVGIGTTSPDKSAVLEINSTDKGLLIPRMTLESRDLISNPAKGLLIFQTNSQDGFYFYTGESWKPLTDNEARSVAADPNDWSFGGNTPPAGSFVGTTNSQPLIFKVNSQSSGYINSNGNTYFGYQSGLNLANGNNNVGIGLLSVQSITTGSNNVGVGPASLNKNTAGNNNSAIGLSSLRENLTGSNNLAFGNEALRLNTSGSSNTAVGSSALKSNASGVFNVAVGSEALSNNTTGTRNLALGERTLFSNTTGQNNVAIGSSALYSSTDGLFNVAIGLNSLRNQTTGNDNVGIGPYALQNNISGSGNVAIGNYAAQNETGSNKLYIANSATTMPLVYGDFSAKYVTIGNVTPALRNQGVATGGYNLLVKGGILTEKVKVALAVAGTDWADYVFEPSYNLMPLEEVESFTKANKHLPNVPSADAMVESGLDVAQTSKMFMEKIEELTLYMIELNKEVKNLKAENEVLKASLK